MKTPVVIIGGFPHHAGQKVRNVVPAQDSLVVATAERIFADLADPQTINADSAGRWIAPLWQALSDAGLPLAFVDENYGGSGASLAEGFSVIAAAGRAALAVPLAETMLAGHLLAQGGIAAPDGMMSVAPVNPTDRITLDGDGRLRGRAHRVPFAAQADHIVVIADVADGYVTTLIKAASCAITPGTTLAGDSCDHLIVDGVEPLAISSPSNRPADPFQALLLGATMRALQISGALESVLALCVHHANQRVAFERPLAKFQVVQHNLAKLAGEVAVAVAAAGSAADALASQQTESNSNTDAILLEVASAKIRCAEAAEKAAAIAHQLHGAIGFTREHILHRFTQRALGWRDDFGHDSFWAAELGQRVAQQGADRLWPLIASR